MFTVLDEKVSRQLNQNSQMTLKGNYYYLKCTIIVTSIQNDTINYNIDT